MKEPGFLFYAIIVTVSILLALAGLFLLANFERLFRGIRSEVLRRNVVVWLIIFCFVMATTPLSGELFRIMQKYGLVHALIGEACVVTLHTLVGYNLTRWVAGNKRLKQRLSFVMHKTVVLFTLIAAVVLVNLFIRYLLDDIHGEIRYSILISFYFASAVGLVYVFTSYLEVERQKKFDEKELELSRLRELKTKAELDALHSKVNPHFLYNALNSIADLSITDGKKARRMTIALADLFRYSINYSQNNYSTINEEVAMTEVYLEIEKIRFEDQLTYSVQVDPGCGHYLIPRFILQPMVENAVKHGLKATGKLTEIRLAINMRNDHLMMVIQDTGPLFPTELVPGYGVKSVYDKLDLLFPGKYEVHFMNEPQKQVVIYIKKLIKNEPGI